MFSSEESEERDGMGSQVLLLSYKKPPGISMTVKGQLTEAPGYNGRNLMCAAVHVSAFK